MSSPIEQILTDQIASLGEPVVPPPAPVPDDVPAVDIPKDPEPVALGTVRAKHKAEVEFDINASDKLEYGETVSLPSSLEKETKELLEKLPNVNLLDTESVRDWANVVSDGLDLTTFKEVFVKTLENDNSLFKNKLEYNNISLIAKAPPFKHTENSNLKGERAVLRVLNHLGMGSLFQVPLWHSGFWVTFKPPGEAEIVEINRIMMNDKIQLGRYTYGLVFSNITSYTVNRLMDFAISNIYDTTVMPEDINMDNIKNHIATEDLYVFLWGFICTMYPKGFKYKRGCINDAQSCNHVLEDTLNLTKLQWTNTLALTDWQRAFMSSRQPKQKTLAEVKRYKEELLSLKNKKVEIAEDLSFVLKSPSVVEYIDSGYTWISSIVELVDKVLDSSAKDNERNNLIVKHGQASAMRQYGHWIDSIEFGTNTVNDTETINNVLSALSADDKIRAKFMEEVVNFINESTISIIGIPVYECPACKFPQEINSAGIYKDIIPLDVIQLFFTLLTQRLEKLSTR